MNTRENGRSKRDGRRRQQADGSRRAQNGRIKWSEVNSSDEFGASFEPKEIDWATSNGHADSNVAQASGNVSIEDDAGLETHIRTLGTEVAKLQAELEHYRSKLAERSEARRLKEELRGKEAAAEKAREFQNVTIVHLKDKLTEMEREHDRMKARLLELLESSKTQGTQLQEATQQLEASAVRTRQLEATTSAQSSQTETLSAKLRDLEAWNEQLRAEKMAAVQNQQSTSNLLAAKSAEADELRSQLKQARHAGAAVHQAQASWQRDNAELEAIVQRQATDIGFLQDKLRSQQVQPVALAGTRTVGTPKKGSSPGKLQEAKPALAQPLLDEGQLVALFSSLLPQSSAQAGPLSMHFLPELKRRLEPQAWERDYMPTYGTVADFMTVRPLHFWKIPDTNCFYCVNHQHLQPATSSGGAAIQPPPGVRFVVTPPLSEVLAKGGSVAQPVGPSGRKTVIVPQSRGSAQQNRGQTSKEKASVAQQSTDKDKGQAPANGSAQPPGMRRDTSGASPTSQQAKQTEGKKAADSKQSGKRAAGGAKPPGLGARKPLAEPASENIKEAGNQNGESAGEAKTGGGGKWRKNKKRGGANKSPAAQTAA